MISFLLVHPLPDCSICVYFQSIHPFNYVLFLIICALSFVFFFFCILGHLTSSTARTTLFSLRNLAKLLYLSAPVMLRCVSLIIWVLSSHSLSFPLISSLAYIYICSSHLIAFALYSAVRSCMSGEIRTTH